MAHGELRTGNKAPRPWAPRLEELLDVIRRRVAVGIVFSGNPRDNDTVIQRTANARPWKSYRAVAEDIAAALTAHRVETVEVIEEGPALRTALERRRFQLLWLNSAGVQGRAPTAHASALLESLGYPYIGHTPLQTALLDDKVLFKQWLRGVKLPTSPFLVRAGGFKATVSRSDPDYAIEFGPRFEGPYLIKPALGRGSVDVQVVDDLETLNSLIPELTARTNDRVIIEQFLPGQEYCVWASRGITVRDAQPLTKQLVMTFGQAERLFPIKERIYSKIEVGNRISDPCRPLFAQEQRLKNDLAYLARAIFTGLALYVPVRVDTRLSETGELSVLEVNPKPDLKRPRENETGLLGTALSDLQCSYEDFIWKILADWLDFHLNYSPAALAMLMPLFQRYAGADAASQ